MSPAVSGPDDDTLPTKDPAFLEDLRRAVVDTPTVVIDWSAVTDKGPVRTVNEDAFGHREPDVYVVADGMGGRAGGQLAATTAIDAFLGIVDEGDDWRDRMRDVNAAVRAAAATSGVERAGTTLVAVVVRRNLATVVAIGDSRVYLSRHGDVRALTYDHTLRTEIVEAGLDLDDYVNRGVRLGGLTAYLGMDELRLEVDVTAVGLSPGDRLLLCSDGIHRPLTHDELTVGLAGATAADSTERLLTAARRAGSRDNATAMVLDLDAEGDT